ncbi:MAG: coproporphyrinogen III oxidase, partial [Bartonella sp.]|nr:coproporphyrinogen III oxidase [Bartonella sp.]
TLTQEITSMYDLPAYEISNHAIPGAESCHNLLYWRYHEYAGFGPGAHGRFIKQSLKNSSFFSETFPSKIENHNRYVTINEKHPENWLKLVETTGHGCIDIEHLSQEQQANEMLLMGLRLAEGLDLKRYETLSCQSLSQKNLIRLQQQGLIEITDNQHLKATTTGRIFLDHIICQLAN